MKINTAVILWFCSVFLVGCGTKIKLMAPQLHTIDANVTKLTNCIVTYNIENDGNITVPVGEAMCVTEKLAMCEKNCKKLEIANVALNGQIMLLNSIKNK